LDGGSTDALLLQHQIHQMQAYKGCFNLEKDFYAFDHSPGTVHQL